MTIEAVTMITIPSKRLDNRQSQIFQCTVAADFDIAINALAFHYFGADHNGSFEGVPWERWILRNFLKMRVHARPSFIVTINLPSFVTLIRCFIGRSKPLGRLEEFGQAVFHKEVKIQRSPGTPSFVFA